MAFATSPDEVLLRCLPLTDDLEADLESWCQHCAASFAERKKPPLASYFRRHWASDPNATAEGIRCATIDGGRAIVSSVRVFVRRIRTGVREESAAMGGIGEVGTQPAWQRRGLSRRLMADSIDWMKSQEIQLSVLHGAPHMQQFYGSMGYVSMPVFYAAVPVSPHKLAEDESLAICAIEPGDFDQVCSLHNEYCTNAGFAGPVIRSREYWHRWVSQELPDGKFVALGQDGRVLAYAAFNIRTTSHGVPIEPICFLADFAVDPKADDNHGHSALMRLLQVFMVQRSDSATSSISALAVPLAVTSRWPGSWEPHEPWTDSGWMYRPLGESEDLSAGAYSDPKRHVVWQIDNY